MPYLFEELVFDRRACRRIVLKQTDLLAKNVKLYFMQLNI